MCSRFLISYYINYHHWDLAEASPGRHFLTIGCFYITETDVVFYHITNVSCMNNRQHQEMFWYKEFAIHFYTPSFRTGQPKWKKHTSNIILPRFTFLVTTFSVKIIYGMEMAFYGTIGHTCLIYLLYFFIAWWPLSII